MKKRILPLLLIAFLCLMLIPFTFASDDGYKEDIPLKYDYAEAFCEGVARVVLNDKCGFINKTGEEVIPLKYDAASSFSDGTALVVLDDKWGLVDNTFKEVLPPKYERLWGFDDGVAWYGQDGKLGLIDETGREIIPPRYDSAIGFVYGIAAVRLGDEESGKWGFINKTGKEIISPKYDYVATPFSEYESTVKVVVGAGDYYPRSHGIVDKNGEVVPPKYDKIEFCGEGMARYYTGRKCGVLDNKGKEVTPPKYKQVEDFFDGMAAVCYSDGVDYDSDAVWGFIDKTGREIVPLTYSKVYNFYDGKAAVERDHRLGFIDKTGREVIPPKYDFVMPYFTDDPRYFVEGLAAVRGGEGSYWGFIDEAGKEIVPCKYLDVHNFSEGMAAVRTGSWEAPPGYDSNWGFIDKTGREVIAPKYSEVEDFIEGMAKVETDGNWGFIDKAGREVVHPKYYSIGDFHEGVAVVQTGNWSSSKYGLIDKTGRVAVPTIYDSVSNCSEGMIVVELNDKWGYIAVSAADPLSSASAWALDGIKSALEKGFVLTDIQGNYKSVITRAEFCRMAVKFVEYKTGKTVDSVLVEKGVSRDQRAFRDTSDADILAAFALGITNGTGDGKFTPDGQFTREQAATMLQNTCKVIGMETSGSLPSGFADISKASSWATGGIDFCRANGIMSGTGGNNFDPKGAYTIEQSILTFDNII